MWDRRYRSWFGSVLRQAVVWVLVPVAVFSSQPTMGCRCDNGRIKLFCWRVVNASPPGREHICDATCDRPCCCETLRRHCGLHGACLEGGSTVGTFAGCADRECCCTPLLHALFTSAKRVGVSTFRHSFWAFVGVDAALAERELLCESTCCHAPGLPPLDLVILHRTLRI